ncbi:protein kinase domain-containing protein [Microbacterium lacticum]
MSTPGVAPTIREASSSSHRATVRESSAGSDRVTVHETSVAAGPLAADRETVRESGRFGIRHAEPEFSRRYRLPSVLEEQYDYIRDIDAGSQAAVVLCEDRQTARQVAIKLYFVSAVDRAALDALAGADARHILPSTLGRGEGMEWEVMEYLPLGSIGEVIDGQRGAAHDAAFVRAFVVEMTDALEHLHSLGVTHRDLKPGNVLIRSFDPLDVVLADFGVSVKAGGTALATVAGTYAYAAPESLNNKPSPKGDWWALGVMAHELLSGRHLLAGTSGDLPSDNEMRARIFEGVFDLDGLPDDRWRMLVAGLLTRDRAERWEGAQVRQWLAGASPRVATAPEPRTITPNVSFAFAGKDYTDPVELTRAIAALWEPAEEALRGRKPGELAEFLVDCGLAEDSAKRIVASGEAARITFAMQRAFTPDEPATFRGRPVTGPGLSSVATAAQDGDGAAAAWITALREQRALTALSKWVNDSNQLGGADDALTSWWSDLGRMLPEWRGIDDLADRLPALTARWEGQLLAASLDPAMARTLRESACAEATRPGDVMAWAAPLRQRALDINAGRPGGTGVAVAALSLLPAAREIERSRTEAIAQVERERLEELRRAEQERRRAAAAAVRRQRTRDTGGEFAARLWLIVPYTVAAVIASTAPFFGLEPIMLAAAYAGLSVLLLSLMVFLWEARVWRVRLLARTKLLLAGLVTAAALWFAQAAPYGLISPTPSAWWLTVAFTLLGFWLVTVILDALLAPRDDVANQTGANTLRNTAPPRRLRVLSRWSILPVALTGAAAVGYAISLTPLPLEQDLLGPMRTDLVVLAEIVDGIDAAIPNPPTGAVGLAFAVALFSIGFVLTTLYRDIARRHPRVAGWALALTMTAGLLFALSAPWLLVVPLAVGAAGAVGVIVAILAILLIGAMS